MITGGIKNRIDSIWYTFFYVVCGIIPKQTRMCHAKIYDGMRFAIWRLKIHIKGCIVQLGNEVLSTLTERKNII